MAWYVKSTNEHWDGPTHEFQGWTWTGATKTAASVKLIEGPDPKPAPKKKKAEPKKNSKPSSPK